MSERNVVYFPRYRQAAYLEEPVAAFLKGGIPALRKVIKRRFREIDAWIQHTGGSEDDFLVFTDRLCRAIDAEIHTHLSRQAQENVR